MNGKSPKSSTKRGQSRNTYLDHRLLDRLGSDGLNFLRSETPKMANQDGGEMTLEQLSNRYYAARQTQGAARRTLEDYETHMDWLQRFMTLEYNGLDNFLPNREVIRAWIGHMMTVRKLMPSTINIRLRTVKPMFNWEIKERILHGSGAVGQGKGPPL